tara:strand:- start:340 stop:744 length:405 start_codon:yes stop_codon:yes gene_type:complete
MDIKKEAKDLGWGLLLVIALYYAIIYFKLTLIQTIILLVAVQVAMLVYQKKFTWFKLLKNTIYISLLIWFIRKLNNYGIWGYVITITVIVVYILFRNWNKYIEVKQHIESMIWGKPLNEYVKEGKRPPKIKINR